MRNWEKIHALAIFLLCEGIHAGLRLESFFYYVYKFYYVSKNLTSMAGDLTSMAATLTIKIELTKKMAGII
jgi:hypothetical protein